MRDLNKQEQTLILVCIENQIDRHREGLKDAYMEKIRKLHRFNLLKTIDLRDRVKAVLGL